jgi:uncharacterized protein (DUF433 family)
MRDRDGTVRVAGTRVTLDTVVRAFHAGASPEEIAEQYPVLGLGDVYSVLAFYLRRRAEVDAYLAQGVSDGQAAAARFSSLRPDAGLRGRLLARRVSSIK